VPKGVLWATAAKETAPSNIIFLSDGRGPPLVEGIADVRRCRPGTSTAVGVGRYTPKPIPRTDEREGDRLLAREDVIQVDSSLDDGAASREHLSALRERHLRALAERVGFEYARLIGPESISEAMRDPRFARARPVPIDLYWVPVAAALLLLVIRFRPDVRRGSAKGTIS
jgi:mxaL protein